MLGLKRGLLLGATASLIFGVGAGLPAGNAAAATQAKPVTLGELGPAFGPRVPDFDLRRNLDQGIARPRTAAQRDALAAFLSAHPRAVARWDETSGSIDVIYGFAAPTSGATPEAAARAFIAEHAGLLGVTEAASLVFDRNDSRAALGGHLLRFNQTVNGLPVIYAGLGIVMDGAGNVRAISGPFYGDMTVGTAPSLSAGQAVAAAKENLAGYASDLPALALDYLNPAYELIEAQLGILATPHPELKILPSAGGGRLVWEFFQFSRNPFGMFLYAVDAQSGEILRRENFVRTQAAPLSFTADVFPTSPPITDALKERGAILDAAGGETERPLGQARVQLRKFDESNVVTGVDGVLTGDHALITNALVSKQPFAQAATGTWHFDRDELPLKGRTEEVDQLEEPAEHQDEISQFFYITSLIEYLDYLHRDGDAVHSRGVGEGAFPDAYPNDDTPLSGTVHIPNVLAPPTDPSDPEFLPKLLALDNAFAVPVATEVEGQEVVVNPTAYGHGFLFNDLAIDFAVPLHEGTHATITPIAGLEGSPEGGALNEGQADVWAYTIGENPTLGGYIVNAFRLRDLIRARGGDPDDFTWLRHADSQLRYSQLGTQLSEGGFEVHQDGEIYAGTVWDLRQLLLQYRTGGSFVRPDQITGEATNPIPLGKEIFERLFLGSMYVLGTMAPDTFVRARDALIIADDVLYPVDAVDPASPGLHRALIERVFASREIGINAAAPSGGRQTISTAVSAFTAAVPGPAAPQRVVAEPTAPGEITVSWQPVEGAFAYQVLKRRAGSVGQRLFEPGEERPGLAPGRDYLDGDTAFSGFTPVEYVYGGGTAVYVDRGQWFGPHAGLGLPSFDLEYAVRAIGIADGGQIGFSGLSATAAAALETLAVTDRMEARLSNVTFTDGIFSFDQVLENLGGAGEFDGTVFEPITFKVLDVSDDSITVANADNGGSGQNGDEAHFIYAETLSPGEVSAPKRLAFNDPQARLFTFDAAITGRVRAAGVPADGSQDPVDTAEPASPPQEFHFVEEFTGIVPVGSTGLMLADGVDFVDVPFTAKASATTVTGTLTADPTVAGVYPDLDFELRDSAGNVLNTSGNLGPNEQVGATVQGGETYVYRVVGWANGPTVFRIASDQSVTDPADAGTGSGGTTAPGTVTRLVRFTVNPLTGDVTTELLDL
ncbi:MAG TPA: M36 family metallopeptidase [Woeseiaceae bacterium]|nr:M36 family metallopeptidase [Woeseiaceae bacterium]